jgi:hypothetical protein
MERGKVSGGSDYILPLGILALGAAVAWKLGLFGTSTSGGGGNANTTKATTAAATTNDVTAAQAAGIPQTLSNSTIAGLATTLNTLFSASPVDQSQVVLTVLQVNSQLDWALLEQAFGTRDYGNSDDWFGLCSALGLDCKTLSLDSALQLIITDPTQKMNLNSSFANIGVNFSL